MGFRRLHFLNPTLSSSAMSRRSNRSAVGAKASAG
jgi:hypothetical protein